MTQRTIVTTYHNGRLANEADEILAIASDAEADLCERRFFCRKADHHSD